MSEKGPTGTYFAPDNLDNYSRDGKGKDIKKEHEEKGREERKAIVALLVSILATLKMSEK